LRQHFRDGRRQGRLAVVHVPYRPDVHVRLAAIKFLFAHLCFPLDSSVIGRTGPIRSISPILYFATTRLHSLEPAMRFELMTSSLPRRRSTPELRGLLQHNLLDCALVQVSKRKLLCVISGAGDETRTRDPQLGRLMLYQLSYTRPFEI